MQRTENNYMSDSIVDQVLNQDYMNYEFEVRQPAVARPIFQARPGARAERKKIYQKWNDEEKKTYWFGLMKMIMENPLTKHSWRNWKIDKCFKKMEVLFNGSKTHVQIKSFDQRMKASFLEKRKMDIHRAIIVALREMRLEQNQAERLRKFEEFISEPDFGNNEEYEEAFKMVRLETAQQQRIRNQITQLAKIIYQIL